MLSSPSRRPAPGSTSTSCHRAATGSGCHPGARCRTRRGFPAMPRTSAGGRRRRMCPCSRGHQAGGRSRRWRCARPCACGPAPAPGPVAAGHHVVGRRLGLKLLDAHAAAIRVADRVALPRRASSRRRSPTDRRIGGISEGSGAYGSAASAAPAPAATSGRCRTGAASAGARSALPGQDAPDRAGRATGQRLALELQHDALRRLRGGDMHAAEAAACQQQLVHRKIHRPQFGARVRRQRHHSPASPPATIPAHSSAASSARGLRPSGPGRRAGRRAAERHRTAGSPSAVLARTDSRCPSLTSTSPRQAAADAHARGSTEAAGFCSGAGRSSAVPTGRIPATAAPHHWLPGADGTRRQRSGRAPAQVRAQPVEPGTRDSSAPRPVRRAVPFKRVPGPTRAPLRRAARPARACRQRVRRASAWNPCSS